LRYRDELLQSRHRWWIRRAGDLVIKPLQLILNAIRQLVGQIFSRITGLC
jgi:hypothetical protein